MNILSILKENLLYLQRTKRIDLIIFLNKIRIQSNSILLKKRIG